MRLTLIIFLWSFISLSTNFSSDLVFQSLVDSPTFKMNLRLVISFKSQKELLQSRCIIEDSSINQISKCHLLNSTSCAETSHVSNFEYDTNLNVFRFKVSEGFRSSFENHGVLENYPLDLKPGYWLPYIGSTLSVASGNLCRFFEKGWRKRYFYLRSLGPRSDLAASFFSYFNDLNNPQCNLKELSLNSGISLNACQFDFTFFDTINTEVIEMQKGNHKFRIIATSNTLERDMKNHLSTT